MRSARWVGFVVLAVLLVSANAFAGGFLKIDGIDGESQDDGHKKWIDIESWSWQTKKKNNVGGGGCGAVKNQDLVVTKRVDGTTPDFVRLVGSCVREPEVILEYPIGSTPDDGTRVQRVMRIRMEGVRVTKVEMGSAPEKEVPTENVSFNFTKIDFEVVLVNRGAN